MKVIILEATAEELCANKRVADTIIDALSNMCDSIARIPWADLPLNDEEAEVNADEKEEN